MFESKINRGKANGYAPLDGSGKVPLDKLPPIQSTIDTGSFLTNDQTGSFATIGSNEFNGNQTINGIIQGTGSLYLKADSNDSRYFEIYNTSPSDTHIKASSGISFFGDDTNYIRIDNTTDDVTIAAFSDIILTADDGGVYIGSYGSGNGVLTNGYLDGVIGDTNMVNNGTGNTITDNLTNIINSIPAAINTSSLATTGSNTFSGTQTINGKLILSSSNIPTNLTGSAGDIKGTIKIDDNSIYYCSQNYNSGTYYVYGYADGTHVIVPNVAGIPAIQSNGWTITINGEPHSITGAYPPNGGDNFWYLEFDNLENSIATSTQLMTLVNTTYVPPIIWEKTDFGFENGKFPTTGSNVFRGNQSISGSVIISSSLVVSSTIVNSGSISAFNTDLVVENGNIILSGSFAQQVNYAASGSGSFTTPATDVTQLDITKDIHLIDITGISSNSHFYLPNGLYDGQVVRFALKGDGTASPNYVFIHMDALRRYDGFTEVDASWSPFYNAGIDTERSLGTAVYIDGAWNVDSPWFNQ